MILPYSIGVSYIKICVYSQNTIKYKIIKIFICVCEHTRKNILYSLFKKLKENISIFKIKS